MIGLIRRRVNCPDQGLTRGLLRTCTLGVLLLALYGWGCSGAAPGETEGPAEEGKLAPPASFQDASGKQYSLSDFRGKVVLLNFWATWCPPCREEMPSLEALNKQMDPSVFQLLALSVDDSWPVVSRFLEQNRFQIPVFADFDSRIASRFGTFKYPETYILDAGGVVVKKVIGPLDWSSPKVVGFLKTLTGRPPLPST
ncbi:MAG: TlpA disulfide reductase family protein [Acidobacteriota bacterium]